MNNSFQKQKNKLAKNIMKAKSPHDFNKIIKNIKSLSANSNHELCSIKRQAHKGQQRMVKSMGRNEQIQFYKQRMFNRSKQAKERSSKKTLSHNNFTRRVNNLRGTFNNRVKELLTNQGLYKEAMNRKQKGRQNYSKSENRQLALNGLR